MPPLSPESAQEKSSFCLNLRGFIRLWPYLWPKNLPSAKARLIVAFFAMLGGKACLMTVPLMFKNLVDGLESKHYITLPLLIIVFYGGARFVAGVCNDVRDGFFAVITESAIREAALKVFRHLHQLGLGFHLGRQTGAVTQYISKGIRSIEEFMQFSTFMLLPTFVEIFFVILIFFKLYGGMTAVTCLITLVLYTLATIRITEWRIIYIQEMNAADAEANHKSIDSLLNFETVKYFNNEEHESARYDKVLSVYEKTAVQSKMSLVLLNLTQNFITSLGLLIIITLAVNSYQHGLLTLGGVIAVSSYLLQLYGPMSTLGFAYRQVRLGLLNMDTMFELLNVTKDIEDRKDAVDLAEVESDVTFDSVEFAYQPERQILKKISFHVPAKSTIAIVGLSGAGKSTLSKLLYRFYDITGGSIKVGGKDIRHVTQKSLRKLIGIVPQDTVLFNETIAYNIQYGDPDASFEMMIEASKKAQIHDFVLRLPDGYNTMVGERGLKLSGGEKQRIAIARTLLKNPKIFLFDEATSSLDSTTEKEIQSQLEYLAKEHTTIMIAHRLSTITHADQIIVMDDGKIMERGRHEELLAQGAIYARLWQKQSQGNEAEIE